MGGVAHFPIATIINLATTTRPYKTQNCEKNYDHSQESSESIEMKPAFGLVIIVTGSLGMIKVRII